MLVGMLCLMLFQAPLQGEGIPPLPADRLVVKVYAPTRAALQDLCDRWAPWRKFYGEQAVQLDLSEDELAVLAAQGYALEVDWDLTDTYHQPRFVSKNQGGGIPGFPCYPTVPETYAQAQAWVATYPDLAEWNDFGDTWEKTQNPDAGHDLRVLVLTNKQIPGPKPSIFIMSSVHAREYAPAGINFELARTLLTQYDQDPDITWLLDHHSFHLVLSANPDGRLYAETGLFWRKNTDDLFCSGSNNRGVDLNRNFDYQWGCCGGSSGSECSEVFRGPTAASEPEIQAIQDYLLDLFPDRRGPGENDPAPDDTAGIFVDVHSAAGAVLWPWGYTGSTSANNDGYRPLGRKAAFFNHYDPLPISEFTIADGSTVDYAYGELGVASFAYEVGTTFFQDCASFQNIIAPDNIDSLLLLARHARAPYRTASGPEPYSLEADTETLPGVLKLRAVLDDTRYNTSQGSEPTQNIMAGRVYLDAPPWAAEAASGTMLPEDGIFNEPVETMWVNLSLDGLSEGRHIAYVVGTDADGVDGPPRAVFFNVTYSYATLLSLWPQDVTVLTLLNALNP